MNPHKQAHSVADTLPQSEANNALEAGLKLMNDIDAMQKEYNALSAKERQNLPQDLQEFFNDSEL